MRTDGEKATAAYNKLLELHRKELMKRNWDGTPAHVGTRRIQSRAILARFAKRLIRKHLVAGGFPVDILSIGFLR